MPELPDVTVYVEALARGLVGARFEGLKTSSPFVLRSVEPPVADLVGRAVLEVRRLGKRIVFVLEGERFIVIHLMIAGRLHFRAPDAAGKGRKGVAQLVFDRGTVVLTEAGSKRRASIHLAAGEAALAEHDRGGVEPLETDLEGFAEALRRERHTLKRSLTDPRLFSGIGNAYSDEILHRARLSPVQLTTNLSDEEVDRLFESTRAVLTEWTDRLRAEAGEAFPEKVTAFRDEMSVHGKYRQPCPVCGTPVQRIRYAENETDYCPGCQTGGRLLADRALSRLLREDWPRTVEELEAHKAKRRG